MKILLVTQYFWPESFRVNDLALDFKQKGHDVTVLTGIPNYPHGSFYEGYGYFKKMREEYKGIQIIRTPLIPRGKSSKIQLALNYVSFFLFACILAPFKLRKKKYDLIFVYGMSPVTQALPALFLKKIMKTPVIFWVQDLWPESLAITGVIRSQRIMLVAKWLVKCIYSGFDRILVQSMAFLPSMDQLEVPKEKIHYLPNSVEDCYLTQNSSNETFKDELPPGFRITYAGNIGQIQAFETIIEAANLLKDYKDIHWIIIGDGSKKNWVENEINKRGLVQTFHLLDYKPVDLMPIYFSKSDILLATLKYDPIISRTIPSKLQSYLACGKPIIASLDGEAARIILEAEAGLVSPAEDAESLVKNILALYNMSSQARDEMGRKGREYFIKHFEKERLLKQLENWMTEVAEENRIT